MPGKPLILLLLLAAALAGQTAVEHRPALRADSDLVLIPASVVDARDRLVLDLARSEFLIYEDKKPQRLTHFAVEEAPVSIAILFDVSRSMKAAIPHARAAVMSFLARARPGDEFCVFTFRDSPTLALEFTKDPLSVEAALERTEAAGGTALLDALVMALHYVKKEARHKRRAILILSDAGESGSRYTWSEVRSLVREADQRVYPFILPGANEEDAFGRIELRIVAEESGGRYFAVGKRERFAQAVEKLEVHWQYVLGYRPARPDRHGSYRRVEVKLRSGSRNPGLKVYWRRSYVAPD